MNRLDSFVPTTIVSFMNCWLYVWAGMFVSVLYNFFYVWIILDKIVWRRIENRETKTVRDIKSERAKNKKRWFFLTVLCCFLQFILYFQNNIYTYKKIVKSCVTVVCYSRVLCIAHPPVSPSTFGISIILLLVFLHISYTTDARQRVMPRIQSRVWIFFLRNKFFYCFAFRFVVVIERETEYINFSITQNNKEDLERVGKIRKIRRGKIDILLYDNVCCVRYKSTFGGSKKTRKYLVVDTHKAQVREKLGRLLKSLYTCAAACLLAMRYKYICSS